MGTILLNEHLTHQNLQGFLNTPLDFNTIIVNVLDHKAGDIVDVGFYLKDVLDHEQGLQHIDSENVLVLMIRIDITVVVSLDNDALMAVIQEILQRIIEAVERYDCPDAFILECHSGLFE